MNQSINTDSKNSKEPQQKYRLGRVSIKILGGFFSVLQDLFYVFLNNFEMAIFLLFSKFFIIFFLHYIGVIFKKREALIQIVLYCFCSFYASLQDEWCYFKVFKKESQAEICNDNFLRTNGCFFFKL